MPTRVFLLRHAKSADPTVFHGAESDVALSERGYQQAELVARYLAPLRPDVIISSAMRRARDTALPLARACGLEVLIEPDLHERRVGALSGTPFGNKEGVWPDTLRHWIAGDLDFAPPGAESFAAIRERVMPVWRRLTEAFAERTLVIVAHGVVCKVLLLSLLEGYSAADWQRLGPMPNIAVNELLRTATGWQALRLNELPPDVHSQDTADASWAKGDKS